MNILIVNKTRALIILLFIIIVIIPACVQKTTRKIINLNNGWEFFYEKDNEWLEAKVPGNIHLDLLNNNLIDDPFYGINSDTKEIDTISKQVWHYKKKFNISTDIYERNLEIVFDGLDTYAEILLNGRKIGETNNMFKRWAFAIEDTIKQKDNVLEVIIKPSQSYNQQKLAEFGVAVDNPRVFTRKAGYQYGWDWGPSFETTGIFKNVYINIWEKLRITNINIAQKEITGNLATMIANIEIESENYYNGDVRIISPANEFDTLHQKLEIFEGKQIYQVEFPIENPKLWWCNGLGDAKLYDVKVQVNTKFRIEEKYTKIGLRNIEFHNNNDENGQEFYFVLNGIPVYAKGANWIPADYFNGRNSYDTYLELLTLAKEANHNMIRVWGGGIYENNDFYDICDSLGIMVWQDFMFANGMYYATDEFIENIKGEVKYQVTRLFNHPSIVLWCGNNEITNGWFDWGWQSQFGLTEADSLRLWNDYNTIFNDVIPNTLSKIDKTRRYVDSSPLYGWGHKKSDTHGDAHYWGVWWGMHKFDNYYTRTGRFMSEYGFQALPDISSLRKNIPEDSLYMIFVKNYNNPDNDPTIKNNRDTLIYSKTLKTHQKHKIGYETINEYMKREYIVPAKFEEYVYMSQVVQAEGLQKAFDAHLSAMPYCMGTLYWQLNDCWPVTSWSAIDYYKSPKALYYYSKKSFQDNHIAVLRKNNTFEIFVVNHKPKPINAEIIMTHMDFNGNVIGKNSLLTNIDKLSSKEIKFNDKTIFSSFIENKTNSFMFIELKDADTKELLYDRAFTATEDMFLLLPEIKNMNYKISQTEGKTWRIDIYSDMFIKNLYLYCDNAEGRFSDNYFNVIPGQTKTIYFYPKATPSDLNIKSILMNNINYNWRNSLEPDFVNI
jgi:beta-mannosidase